QNGTLQLNAQVLDAQSKALSSVTLAWSSLHPAVATVSSTGLVTAVANGTARVRAAYGTMADTATVTVAIPQPPKQRPLAPPSALKTLVEEVVGPVALPPGPAFDSLLTLTESWSEFHWTSWSKNHSYAAINTI